VDTSDADPVGGEPVFAADGSVVGRLSSAAYGFTVDTSVALGYLETAQAVPGAQFEVPVLGTPRRLTVLERPLFDPDGTRLRS
jgi:dimethylglycine dehydrogenase